MNEHTYLVTGANRGIGLEFCRRLKAQRHRVLATARNPEVSPATKSHCDRLIRLDASDPGSVASLADQLKNERVDVLINNAGVGGGAATIDTFNAEETARTLAVNAIGPMLVVQAALKSMRSAERKLIVNITSILGSITQNTGGWSYAYRASKAALNMLTVSLSNELKPEGFTCIALHPGWVRTDMGGKEAPLSTEQSVTSMLETLSRLRATDTGRFLNYDGKSIPW